jgi:hypothetical protein
MHCGLLCLYCTERLNREVGTECLYSRASYIIYDIHSDYSVQIQFSHITIEFENLVTTTVVIACFLSSSSFSFLRLNLFTSKSCAAYLLTVNLSLNLQPPDSDQYHSQLP